MRAETEVNPSLEARDPVNGGGQKSSAPIGVSAALSDNKHCESSRTSPLAGGAQAMIDKVARAILGGEPGDLQELADARAAALDVLEVLAGTFEAGMFSGLRRASIEGHMPSVELHVVESSNRRGQLSLRLHADDETWVPVFLALNAAGFQPGDVVRLSVVRR
jgi:hypothetical protein